MSSNPSKHKFWNAECVAPTRLLLLRHGEVVSSGWRQLYGQMDIALSERGEAQSRTAGEALRPVPVKAVYTSDLSRAHTLATQIAAHHRLAPIVDARLRERRFGDWQGLLWDHIEEHHAEELARYQADRFRHRVPGDSENFEDVRDRVTAFVRETLPRHPGETIVITCHSGPARIILADAMDLPLDSIFKFEQDYCCLNVIDYFDGGRARVQRINDTHHLAGIA